MRVKKPLRDGLNYSELFREPINRLHRKFDDQHGVETVAECCEYALNVLRDPFKYASPAALHSCHAEFVHWYWTHPELFLEVMQTMRRAWFNASDTFKAQMFISIHYFITTERGQFLPIAEATDGEISQAMDSYWKKKIALATVKKARQLLSATATPKGKRPAIKSL